MRDLIEHGLPPEAEEMINAAAQKHYLALREFLTERTQMATCGELVGLVAALAMHGNLALARLLSSGRTMDIHAPEIAALVKITQSTLESELDLPEGPEDVQ